MVVNRITTMGGRAGGGARSGGGGGAGGVRGAAQAAYKAFMSKGAIDYVNGSNSPSALKAWSNYQKKQAAFEQAWKKSGGGNPAWDDWNSLMIDVAHGNVG